ncbi:uncharacterized [Tachysurus ichikawai]
MGDKRLRRQIKKVWVLSWVISHRLTFPIMLSRDSCHATLMAWPQSLLLTVNCRQMFEVVVSHLTSPLFN